MDEVCWKGETLNHNARACTVEGGIKVFYVKGRDCGKSPVLQQTQSKNLLDENWNSNINLWAKISSRKSCPINKSYYGEEELNAG